MRNNDDEKYNTSPKAKTRLDIPHCVDGKFIIKYFFDACNRITFCKFYSIVLFFFYILVISRCVRQMINQETVKNPPQWRYIIPSRCGYRFMKACLLVFAVAFCVLLMHSISYIPKITPIFIRNSVRTQLDRKTNRIQIYPAEPCKSRALPGGIIIGITKGGTHALLTYLALHPQVRTIPHQVNFFDLHYSEGLDWYKKQMPFNCDDQIITIEKTPSYFAQDYVPERIARMNSSVKLLLTVRDPVERTLSNYLQVNATKKVESIPTFENLAYNNVTGTLKYKYRALNRSLYYLHMLPWLKQFPLKQIHIVSAEELVHNPYAVMKGVEQYLGLDPWLSSDMFYFNKTRGFFCYRKESINTCLGDAKGRPHPPMPLQVQTQLQEYFHYWNQKFYKLVGQDFGWQ